MTETQREPYPTMALTLASRRIQPGGKLLGELRLRAAAEPVVLRQVHARLWARVYADFDDDEGAHHVRLLDRPIAGELRLGAGEEKTIDLRLSVSWSTPITLAGGRGLRGLTVFLMLWADAAVPTGDVIRELQVVPLPWQERMLQACRERGIDWDVTYAYSGSQILVRERNGRLPEIRLGWHVHRRWVTLDVNGRSIRLTHQRADRDDWMPWLSERLAGL
ncbi:sporulation protein [Flindersiella endophytica]